MTSARKTRPRLLPIAIAAVLGVGLAALVLWVAPTLLASATDTGGGDTVRASVTTTMPCDGPEPHDTVSYTRGGEEHTVRLDGCGAKTGEHMRIVLPSDGRHYATPVSSEHGQAGSSRMAFVLLAVAAIAGGLIPGLRAPMRRARTL